MELVLAILYHAYKIPTISEIPLQKILRRQCHCSFHAVTITVGMLKRFHKIQIPLAAKCQILYGAAVVLITAATLLVPWQRINALLHDMNQHAAEALSQQVLMQHVIPQPISRSSTQPTGATQQYIPPRLISVDNYRQAKISRFEKRAIRDFLQQPDLTHVSEEYRIHGEDRYRYAKPVYVDASCLACHGTDAGFSITAASVANEPAARPLNRPTTLPIKRELAAIISMDITGVDENQFFVNRLFILIAGTVAGVVAIVVFYLITTRVILHPVRVLQETAQKVSQGDLNIRSDISTGDEFQQLSRTINAMLRNLKISSDQLKSINKALDLKLDQLAQSNVALYESNRLKSEFLANVSHELRTPLNSILGFAELLKDTAAPPDAKSARYVQNIQSSGKNLLELINDLLDLAKIEAGKMEVRSEPLSLGDVFEGLVNLLRPLCEQRQLTIVPAVQEDVPIIQTDPAKLQQMLYNFLSNAIKFSPQGGQIDLQASLDEPGVRISVTDQGPGIDPDKHQMIFEKFRQIDGSATRQHSGTGLGLAISRELALLLGGKIGLISTPGHGATFWIVLPLNIQAGPRDVREKTGN